MVYLEFVFQDFWHFLGTLLLCLAVFGGVSRIFSRYINNYYYEKDDNEKEK